MATRTFSHRYKLFCCSTNARVCASSYGLPAQPCIQAIDWLVNDSKDAVAKAAPSLAEVDKQLADEKGKTDFIKVNEDLKRLAALLHRKVGS